MASTFATKMYDYPEYKTPTLIEIINGGTILMVPYLLLLLLWLTLMTLITLKKLRGINVFSYLISFPVAFGLLAVAQWAYRWQLNFNELLRSGPMDPMQYAQEALSISRSTLLIAGTGLLALICAMIFLTLSTKQTAKQKGEQGGASNGG